MSSAPASPGSTSWGHRCHKPPSAPLTGMGWQWQASVPLLPGGRVTLVTSTLFVATLPALSLALPGAGVPGKPHRQCSRLCACHASLHQSTNTGTEWGCGRREGKNKISGCQRQSLPRAASLPMVGTLLALET